MKISVIGLGYIGLPTLAVIASKGIQVVGVDSNQSVVNKINLGQSHIVEPGLNKLVQAAVQSSNLRATLIPEDSDVFIVAVPTPITKDKEPDLTYIKSAVKSIAKVIKKGDLVILESTSPVGTTEKIINWLNEDRKELRFPEFGNEELESDIAIAYCPERVMPGQAIREIVENDRVIGGVTKVCARKAELVYKIFLESECFLTDCRTAELSKLVENSYRDVNIAFANELSLVCKKLDINIWNLIKLANRHPRVDILNPGPGVGGHCISVDPWFIVNSAKKESQLIQQARNINNSMPSFVIDKIKKSALKLKKNFSDISISCLGLSFKADIDDLRESPALEISIGLSQMGFKWQFIVEPNIEKLPNTLISNNIKLVDLYSAINDSEIVVLLVDHSLFKKMDLGLLSGKQVIDTRGIWS